MSEAPEYSIKDTNKNIIQEQTPEINASTTQENLKNEVKTENTRCKSTWRRKKSHFLFYSGEAQIEPRMLFDWAIEGSASFWIVRHKQSETVDHWARFMQREKTKRPAVLVSTDNRRPLCFVSTRSCTRAHWQSRRHGRQWRFEGCEYAKQEFLKGLKFYSIK